MKRTRFDQIIGTGGIGAGILFELDGNRPISRNETRLARLSQTRDYCKQHIILHYIARILAPEVCVRAIGMVGADASGDALLAQMRGAGIDIAGVGRSQERPTMYCVCMQYPDKAVCNLTTSESACALVSADYVARALDARPMDARTLAVAAPEVPVAARIELLRRAHAAGAYGVSSLLVDEVAAFCAGGGFALTDLLAVNEDEAAACLGARAEAADALAARCHARLKAENPKIRLVMTCGARGSYVCEGNELRFIEARRVRAVATGGAGDAYVAGVICGLALGLPFLPGSGVCAPELGAELAAQAVCAADTIAPDIDRHTVEAFIQSRNGGASECD